MKGKKNKTLDDVIKAARKGSREAEQELLGPGFHSRNQVHRSKKIYSRKDKHRPDYADKGGDDTMI